MNVKAFEAVKAPGKVMKKKKAPRKKKAVLQADQKGTAAS